MNEEELELIQCLVDDIHFLLDYPRRVVQRQVDRHDAERMKEVRKNLKKAKEVFVCL